MPLGTPVFWYCPTLQDDSAEVSISDLSVGGRDLTNLGTWVADTDNGGTRAVELSGLAWDSYPGTPPAEFASLDGVTGHKTLSAWIKPNGFSGNYTGINIFKGSSHQGESGFVLSADVTGGVARGKVSSGTTSDSIDGGTTPPSTWRHILMTVDRDTTTNVNNIRLYVDGSFVGSSTSTAVPDSALDGIAVGTTITGTGNKDSLDGRWDDIRGYDYILSDAEITLLASKRGYIQGLGSEKAWWCPSLQDDSALSTVSDITDNGYDLTNFNTDSSNWVADTDEGGVRAVDLNGTDECHTATTPIDGLVGTDFSLSIWSRKDNTNHAHYIGLYNTTGINNGNQDHHRIGHTDNGNGTNAGSYRNFGPSSRQVAANDNITNIPTTWRHLAATFSWNGSAFTITAFVDGVQVAQGSVSSVTVPDAMNLVGIGSNLRTDDNDRAAFLNGRWDDARVFDSILTQDEITHLASARGIQGAPAPRKEGLGKEVAHWCPSWQDDSAGSTITDYTLNGYDMNPINMGASNWVADTSEGGVRALDFNGTNEYCQTDLNNVPYSSLDAQLQTSVSAWVYGELTSTNGNPWAYAKTQGGFSTRRAGYRLVDRGGDEVGQCAFSSNDSNSSATVSVKPANGSQPRSTWYHVYAEFEKSAVGSNQNGSTRLWIDGVYIGEDSDATNIFDDEPLHRMFLGQNTRTAGNLETTYFDGRLDDIRFFGEHLTQDEVTHLATSRGVEGSPVRKEGLGSEVAHWCPSWQDDSAESTIEDYTLNGYDLTNFNTDSSNWVADTDEGGVRAVDLNGTNEYHTVTSPVDGLVGTDFSLSIWSKKDDTSQGHFLGLYNDTGSITTRQDHHRIGHAVSSGNGTNAGSYRNFTTRRNITAKDSITNNPTTWRHLAATFSWSGSTFTITSFIDGVQIDQVSGAVTIPDAMNLAAIGCNLRGGGSGLIDFLNGRWDDARVFDSILTQDEVTHLATSRGIEGAPASSVVEVNGVDAESITQAEQVNLPDIIPVVDAESISEASTATLIMSPLGTVDGESITEAASVEVFLRSVKVTNSESVSDAETPSLTLYGSVTPVDTQSVSDAARVTVVKRYGIQPIDTESISDAALGTIQHNIGLPIVDAESISDSARVEVGDGLLFVTDTQSRSEAEVLDNSKLLINKPILVTDAESVSDAATVDIFVPKGVAVSDGQSLSEAGSVFIPIPTLVVTDTESVSSATIIQIGVNPLVGYDKGFTMSTGFFDHKGFL